METSIISLNNDITACRACPRLVAWREQVAREKVKRFTNEGYWGKPVPGFGDEYAQVLIVGLDQLPTAPTARGVCSPATAAASGFSARWINLILQTSRNQLQQTTVLELFNCYITAAVHCAPPDNKPTKEEFANCNPFLMQEIELLKDVSIVVLLGKNRMGNGAEDIQGGGKGRLRPHAGILGMREWGYDELIFIG